MRHKKRDEPQAQAPAVQREQIRPALSQDDLQIERNRTRQLAEQYGLVLADFRTVTPDPAATALIDEQTARALAAIPLAVDAESITVAVADPAVAAELEALLGRRVTLQLAAPSDILLAIGNAFRALTGIDARVKLFEARDVLRKDSTRVAAATANEDAPVVH